MDALLFGVIALALWFSIWTTIREAKKTQRTAQSMQYVKRLMHTAKTTETLLELQKILPLSDMLCAILLGRKLRCLTLLKQLSIPGVEEAWDFARSRYHEHRGNITESPPVLQLPAHEETRQKMYRGSLRVLAFLRKEMNSNPSHPEWVRVEISRMTEIHITLQVHGLMLFAQKSSAIGREGTARQSLQEARDLLMQHQQLTDLSGLKEDVIRALDEHKIQHALKPILPEVNESTDGLERMFGEKQGW